jgi:hypothetical protein
MTDIERNPIVQRAIDELRKTTPLDHAAVSRVVAAAAAARVAPSDDEISVDAARSTRRRWMLGGVAAAAVIAFAVVSFAVSDAHRSRSATVSSVAAAKPAETAERSVPTTTALQPVANSVAEAPPIARQFVFNNRRARSVSLVGDFNRWNSASAPMTRAADGDLWSITVPVLPGRHLYAFMVDDSLFTLDPRQPTGRDTDLGVEASVVIVGKP